MSADRETPRALAEVRSIQRRTDLDLRTAARMWVRANPLRAGWVSDELGEWPASDREVRALQAAAWELLG